MENICGGDWSSYYFGVIDTFFFLNVIHKPVTLLKLTACEPAYQPCHHAVCTTPR